MKKQFLFPIKILLSLFLAITFLTNSFPTHASELRLSTSPLPINIKTEPGSSTTTQIKIKNEGNQTENIKVTLMKFKADSKTGSPILMDKEATDDYFNWVSFSEDKFSLPKNEWKTITVNFNIPKEASFGYYYAVVFSREDEIINTNEGQTVIAGGTATLILLEAQIPNAKKEIKLTEFSADKGMYEFLPATFSVKLNNSGNVHSAPRGNIFISKGKEKNIASLEVNLNNGSILPDSPREFQEKWSDGFPNYIEKKENDKIILDKSNNPVQKFNWDFSQVSKLRFGKYTAKLVLVYDDGKKDVPIESEVSFWVVPWRLIVGGVVIFLVFFFLGRLSNKISFKKRKKKKNDN